MLELCPGHARNLKISRPGLVNLTDGSFEGLSFQWMCPGILHGNPTRQRGDMSVRPLVCLSTLILLGDIALGFAANSNKQTHVFFRGTPKWWFSFCFTKQGTPCKRTHPHSSMLRFKKPFLGCWGGRGDLATLFLAACTDWLGYIPLGMPQH